MPRWMDGIAGYSPGKALVVGIVLGAVNPKNVIVGLAAAVVVSAFGVVGAPPVQATSASNASGSDRFSRRNRVRFTVVSGIEELVCT